MEWTVYEILSAASGAAVMGTAMLPTVSTKDRLWAVLAGAALIGYAYHAAGQPGGTYTFPALMFAIPFAGAGYFVVSYRRGRAQLPRHRARPPDQR
jgi:hypothetical protein